MIQGKYITEKGSTLHVRGEYAGVFSICFDWLEEGGCIDCRCQSYPENFGDDDWRLVWYCEHCGGGNAKLKPFNEGCIMNDSHFNFTESEIRKIRNEANKAKRLLFDKAEVQIEHSITALDIKIILNTMSELFSKRQH